MRPVYCRKCRAEALVEPTAYGWKVACSALPAVHQAGPCKGRDKAIRVWNEMQEEVSESAGSGDDRAAPA